MALAGYESCRGQSKPTMTSPQTLMALIQMDRKATAKKCLYFSVSCSALAVTRLTIGHKTLQGVEALIQRSQLRRCQVGGYDQVFKSTVIEGSSCILPMYPHLSQDPIHSVHKAALVHRLCSWSSDPTSASCLGRPVGCEAVNPDIQGAVGSLYIVSIKPMAVSELEGPAWIVRILVGEHKTRTLTSGFEDKNAARGATVISR
ncbi:hypothetical protein DL98DRAFT_593039 [Cadophora sp. DSE1049]|nr:hypothetical protein DL98DRAFT_593039 [Cadophora sp. DSE1049]